jgi:hypothetical protein
MRAASSIDKSTDTIFAPQMTRQTHSLTQYHTHIHARPPRPPQIYTYIDIAGCLFLFVSFFWMKQFQKQEDRILDRHAVTASDFTVKVTNLPPRVSEAALRAHFARVLEVPVAEVAIAFDDGALIEQHKLRGLLLKRRDYVVNRIRYIKELQRTRMAGVLCGGVGG